MVLAVVIIVAEVAVVAICTPATIYAGFVLAAVELAVLTGGIALTLRRGLAAPCRCLARPSGHWSTASGTQRGPRGVRGRDQ